MNTMFLNKVSGSTPSMERQEWVEKVVKKLRVHFKWSGYTVPDNVRVAVGFPRFAHGGKRVGECWSNEASQDDHYEIFASPTLGHDGKPKPGQQATVDVIEVIAHEMVHATVGIKAGHKKPFKECAVAIGLEGKMTATVPGPKMISFINSILNDVGEFPAGAINANMRKKKKTYLIKCECPDCGYATWTTSKWLVQGSPVCPVDETAMEEK